MSRKIISQDGWYLFGMESSQTIKRDIVAGTTSNDNSHNFLNDHIIANHTANVDSAYIVKKHNPLRCWIKGNNYWGGTVNVESNVRVVVKYQWFYDDEIITDATSANFVLGNFSYGSTSMTNAIGSSYDPTKLSVAVKNSNGDKAVSAAADVIIVGTSRDGIQKTTDNPAEEQWDKSWTNEVNGVLTAYYTFDDSSSTITYKWQKYVGSAYSDITDATDDMYALVKADVGSKIRCKVTKTPLPSGSPDDYYSNDYIFIGPSNSPFNASDWAPVIYSGQDEATDDLTSNDEILDYGNTTWKNNTEMNVGIWVKVINHADTIPPEIKTSGTVEAIESNFVKRDSGDIVAKDDEVLTDYYAVDNEDANQEFQLYSKSALTGGAAGLARSRLGAGGSGSNLTLSRNVAKDELLIGNDGVSKYNYYVVVAANANANFQVYVKEAVSHTVIRSLFTSASRDITAIGSVVARTIQPVYKQVIKIPLTKNIASINEGTANSDSLYTDFTITITDARSGSTQGDKFPSATRTTYPKNIESDGSDLILTLDTYTPTVTPSNLHNKITNGPFIFNEGGNSNKKDNVNVSYTKNTSEIKDSADNALQTFGDTTAITVTNNCNRDNISPVVSGTTVYETSNYTTGKKVRITFNVDITTETTTTNDLGDLDVNDFLIAYQDKRSPVQIGIYEDAANSINTSWTYVSTSNSGQGPTDCQIKTGDGGSGNWTGNSFCVIPQSATFINSTTIELELPTGNEIYGKTGLAEHNVHVKYTNGAHARSIIDKSEFKNRVNTFTEKGITNNINIYNTRPVFNNTESPISETTKADSERDTSIGTISKKTDERTVDFELVEYERDNSTIASFFATSPTYSVLPSAKVVDDADMHFTKTGTNSLNILLTKEPNFIFGTYLTSTTKQSKGQTVGSYTVLNDAGKGEPFEVALTSSDTTVLTETALKTAADSQTKWSLNKYWNVTPPGGGVISIENKFSRTIKHVGGVTNGHTYYFLVKMTNKSHAGSSPTPVDLITYSPMMRFTPTQPLTPKKLYHQTESLVAANIAMYNGNFVWYYDRYSGDVAVGPWANGVGKSGWQAATGSYSDAYAGFGVVNTQFAERFNNFDAGNSHSANNLGKISFKGSLANYSNSVVSQSRIERGRGTATTFGFEPGGDFDKDTLSTYIGVEDESTNFFLKLNDEESSSYGYKIFTIETYDDRLKHGSTVTANDDADSDQFNYLKYRTTFTPTNQQFLVGGGPNVISSSNVPAVAPVFSATENGPIKTALAGPSAGAAADPYTGAPQIYIFNVGRDKDID